MCRGLPITRLIDPDLNYFFYEVYSSSLHQFPLSFKYMQDNAFQTCGETNESELLLYLLECLAGLVPQQQGHHLLSDWVISGLAQLHLSRTIPKYFAIIPEIFVTMRCKLLVVVICRKVLTGGSLLARYPSVTHNI